MEEDKDKDKDKDKDAEIAAKMYIMNMENKEDRKIRGVMTYLVIFLLVSVVGTLGIYDKISPEVTTFIFGLIMGTMLATLGGIQKEWFNDKEE